ncbi:MAG: 1-acyl-sn-glycerol-3-phosphate acyltransferase [Pseudomonadales bacterium]
MGADISGEHTQTGAMAGDEFDDIRPYRDEEVADVIDRLLDDRELLAAVTGFVLPWLAPMLRLRVAPLLGIWLRRRTRHIQSIRQFQELLENYFARMVDASTEGFTWDGLDQLRPGDAHVFVSNHRDIAMDSGFMNYALWCSGFDTSRSAIGDNLLRRHSATDLMRLNKGFVVRRSGSGMKAMYANHMVTSRYIHHSIGEGQSVWIAQRDGRAKDGLDRTEPAIIKMFHLSQRKTGTFGEAIDRLAIVPVSVSYEFDPCDLMKARELFITETEGRYEKPADEDMKSIVQGIVGFKGRVHLTFAKRLGADFETPQDVAAAIDRQIIGSCRIHGTHADAFRRSGGTDEMPWLTRALDDYSAGSRRRFDQRLKECPEPARQHFLRMYANQVWSRLALDRGEI